jgi:lysophospholipase L1-like esterase
MKSLLLSGLVLAGLGTGCAMVESLDSSGHGLEGRNYVAQGDSYASGTGTREYYDSTCLRSDHSYAKQLAADEGMNLSHVACSGARIPDVRANQLDALSELTDIVTISIGGNDAGFSSVITQCAKPWPWTCTADIDNARSFISNTLPGQLDGLYTDIATRAPNARVMVIGYPRLFNGEQCNFFARISAAEQTALNGVADLLATKISEVATAHGFDYVDPRDAFNSHRVCDDVEWLNGLSDPIVESYHPNRLGHDAFTRLISSQL